LDIPRVEWNSVNELSSQYQIIAYFP
jgi:hypothetical protein